MKTPEINIIPAEMNDTEEILTLQQLAYHSEAEIYRDYQIQPLVQTIAKIKDEFFEKIFLKAIANNQIIGSVRAVEKQGTCYIGKLIVHPGFQNQGLGKKLMAEIESRFQSVQRFELYTGYKSDRNIYIYKKLGYKIFKRERVSDTLVLIYFEKYNLPDKPAEKYL
jgi:ribosomal protein S18 acetylase RimI-like enzyme